MKREAALMLRSLICKSRCCFLEKKPSVKPEAKAKFLQRGGGRRESSPRGRREWGGAGGAGTAGSAEAKTLQTSSSESRPEAGDDAPVTLSPLAVPPLRLPQPRAQ